MLLRGKLGIELLVQLSEGRVPRSVGMWEWIGRGYAPQAVIVRSICATFWKRSANVDEGFIFRDRREGFVFLVVSVAQLASVV